ncbi:hypothetical protein ERJ75_000314900 [Trypanosoma vivax]|nr:hypothetical protein ERJ75_000314900 [Trypanosoma vivax]
MSLGWIVTRPLWMHARFVSASSDTMYDSVAPVQPGSPLLWSADPPSVLRHLAHEALEGRLLQQQVRGALELADLAERHLPASSGAARASRQSRRPMSWAPSCSLRRHRLLRAGSLLGARHGAVLGLRLLFVGCWLLFCWLLAANWRACAGGRGRKGKER